MRREKHSKTKKGEKEDTPSFDSSIYDLQYFIGLDSENRICFDCGGPFPTHASINHGVFICSNCARNHEKLGFNISYVQQVNSQWDYYLLSFVILGGNSKFKKLCDKYEVPCQSFNEDDEEKLNKYKIKLGEYYRTLLKSEISADEPPTCPDFEDAKKPCDSNNIIFPEFENYHLFKGNLNVSESNLKEKISKATGKIYNFGKYTGSKCCSIFKGTYKKIKKSFRRNHDENVEKIRNKIEINENNENNLDDKNNNFDGFEILV